MYMTHVNASNLFYSIPRPSRHHIGTAKMRGKLVQQAHWANGIEVEEHEHVVIKLASDTDFSTLPCQGLEMITFIIYNP